MKKKIKKKTKEKLKTKEKEKGRKRIYMDYAATTPMREEVIEEMLPYLGEKFGNASSIHSFGMEAKIAMENSREKIAKALKVSPEEIIFTSGGTEANNLALIGYALANKEKGNHIITSSIEHASLLETCKYLESLGFKITYLPVDKFGLVSPADVREAITEKTILISIMHANNEIGTIQPIEDIARIAKEKNVTFHTDAIQTFGKIIFDTKNIDMISISAHKIYGPKGIGALVIKKGINIIPILHGGGHEKGIRSGTENVPAIVGFGKASELAFKEISSESKRIKKLRDKIIDFLLDEANNKKLMGVRINGSIEKRLFNNVNMSFSKVEGEALVKLLDDYGIATSTGSACSSHKLEPSHVLLAIGLTPQMAHGSLRVTLGKYNTEDDVNYFLEVLPKCVEKLREISKGLTKEEVGEEE
jgi:cysteine desulfurase